MPARFSAQNARVKRMRWLLDENLERVIEGMASPHARKKNLAIEANLQRNAISTLSSVLEGKLTKTPETPKSVAAKLANGDTALKLYAKSIHAYLRHLGFGEILERQGLEAALSAFEKELAEARQKK